jgi:DNA-binding MarR family transcriptional regulator
MKGVFSAVFDGSVAKVLDQALYVGNMEQTIPMLAESTGMDYKTVKAAAKRLEKCGFMKRGRKISNAQTYRFEVEKDLHHLIEWAENRTLAKNTSHL